MVTTNNKLDGSHPKHVIRTLESTKANSLKSLNQLRKTITFPRSGLSIIKELYLTTLSQKILAESRYEVIYNKFILGTIFILV